LNELLKKQTEEKNFLNQHVEKKTIHDNTKELEKNKVVDKIEEKKVIIFYSHSNQKC